MALHFDDGALFELVAEHLVEGAGEDILLLFGLFQLPDGRAGLLQLLGFLLLEEAALLLELLEDLGLLHLVERFLAAFLLGPLCVALLPRLLEQLGLSLDHGLVGPFHSILLLGVGLVFDDLGVVEAGVCEVLWTEYLSPGNVFVKFFVALELGLRRERGAALVLLPVEQQGLLLAGFLLELGLLALVGELHGPAHVGREELLLGPVLGFDEALDGLLLEVGFPFGLFGLLLRLALLEELSLSLGLADFDDALLLLPVELLDEGELLKVLLVLALLLLFLLLLSEVLLLDGDLLFGEVGVLPPDLDLDGSYLLDTRVLDL